LDLKERQQEMMSDSPSRTGASPADVKLDRPIGLFGGIALVIGGVIGMGIYALIAAVGAQAGSTLWMAFLIAMIVSAIGVAPLIQIASALPRAGGGYLYTSRLLNPLMGTIVSNLAVLGGASSTAMVALGLAGYVVPYLPFAVWLIVFAVVTVVSSLGFVAIVLLEMPVVGIVYIGWVALLTGYYFLRVNWLKKTGVDWDTRIRQLPGYDEE
jgi:amino acid transporter